MSFTDFVCRVDDTDPDQIITDHRSDLSCFAEMFFENNAIETNLITVNTPVKVSATYSPGTLFGFNHVNGLLIHTDASTREFTVTCSMTVRAGGAQLDKYNFYVFLNSVIMAKTEHAVYMDDADASVKNIVLQLHVELIENDTLSVFVENTIGTQNALVENLNFTVSRI